MAQFHPAGDPFAVVSYAGYDSRSLYLTFAHCGHQAEFAHDLPTYPAVMRRLRTLAAAGCPTCRKRRRRR